MVDKKKPRILVIEDRREDREILRHHLTPGHEIVEVGSGVEALTCIENQKFDAVILDYHLPDLTGDELIPHLQEAGCGVIVVTSFNVTKVAVEIMQNGADDYLPKENLGREDLRQRLAEVIQRNRLRERLNLKHRQLEEFASCAAHDLKAPLRRISNFFRFVMEESHGALSPDLLQSIDSMIQSSQELQGLVNELLEYARLGMSESAREPVQLDAVVNEAVRRLRGVGDDVDIQVDPLPEVEGDHDQLVQLFLQLLDNGIKFGSSGRIHIHIEGREREDEVELRVQDNGIGMRPDQLEEIFSPLTRLRSREVEGHGLGLAICQKIVEKHGGTIRVESSPGSGTVFSFTLPALRETGELDLSRSIPDRGALLRSR